jgi:hypothetical protein
MAGSQKYQLLQTRQQFPGDPMRPAEFRLAMNDAMPDGIQAAVGMRLC